ncbi:hypothetical protein N9C39_11380 [Luminiphilus sp.]|nr:hypothetical protein [Luminiphilus sp.]
MKLKLFLGVILGLLTLPAQAYLGPGMGAGALGVFFGIIASVLIAIFAVVWFPIKRYLRSRKRNAEDDSPPGNADKGSAREAEEK